MKLQKIHLFILLIFVLMASTFGWTVKEYMTNRGDIDEEPESEDILPGRGGRDPFLPGVPTPRPKRRRCIPDGDEDYYVLKSQVVPPVCPKCPDTRACPRQKNALHVPVVKDARKTHLNVKKYQIIIQEVHLAVMQAKVFMVVDQAAVPVAVPVADRPIAPVGAMRPCLD